MKRIVILICIICSAFSLRTFIAPDGNTDARGGAPCCLVDRNNTFSPTDHNRHFEFTSLMTEGGPASSARTTCHGILRVVSHALSFNASGGYAVKAAWYSSNEAATICCCTANERITLSSHNVDYLKFGKIVI